MNRKVFGFSMAFILVVAWVVIATWEYKQTLSDQNVEDEIASLQELPNVVAPAVEIVLEASTDITIDTVVETLSETKVEYSPEVIAFQLQGVKALCEEIGNKLGSVSVDNCLAQELLYGGGESVNNRPLVIRDFPPENRQQEKGRVLIIGGIHGDEYSSISIMFKWMDLLTSSSNEAFLWRFVPSANPDGLLDGKAVRQNANGVDLNRNFPTQDWDALALKYWRDTTASNPRRNPGGESSSEPEVRWIVEQINSFKPTVIISVHAPYHLLDFDGPAEAPSKIGELYLHELGVYPGSLGNYAGLDLGIPVVTLELSAAGIMPGKEEIEMMWDDLLTWVHNHTSQLSSELQ